MLSTHLMNILQIMNMKQDPECISLKQRPASLLFFLPKKQKIELKKLSAVVQNLISVCVALNLKYQ